MTDVSVSKACSTATPQARARSRNRSFMESLRPQSGRRPVPSLVAGWRTVAAFYPAASLFGPLTTPASRCHSVKLRENTTHQLRPSIVARPWTPRLLPGAAPLGSLAAQRFGRIGGGRAPRRDEAGG